MTMNYIGKIAHVLKHLHGRCVVGDFDKKLHEGYIWTEHRAVLYFSLHNYIFLHFVHHCTKSYDRYKKSDDRKIIVMMMGVVFFLNIILENFIMQNIRRHMLIEVMLFTKIILNIQE